MIIRKKLAIFMSYAFVLRPSLSAESQSDGSVLKQIQWHVFSFRTVSLTLINVYSTKRKLVNMLLHLIYGKIALLIERFFRDLEKWFRYVFVICFISQWKHGLFVFPPKKTLIWRRHCSIGQSCRSMTSKRSIDWFLEISWEFFHPSVRLTN